VLLSPLSEDEQTTFIVVSLPEGVLRKLVGRLGTAPKGTRLDALSVWELADTLVDYYATDAEVSDLVDKHAGSATPRQRAGLHDRVRRRETALDANRP